MIRLASFLLSLGLLLAPPVAQGQSSDASIANDQVSFGRTVAVGADHVFVGAPRDANTPGRVYVYVQDEAGPWEEQGVLDAEDGRVGDGFGAALAATGDTLVVGAPSADAVYVFHATADGCRPA
jgi:hypothetical protein